MESPRSPYMRDSKCGVSHPMQTPQKNACYVGSTKNLKLSYGLTTNKTRSSKEYISAVWPTMSTRWTTPTTLLSAIFKSSPLKRSQMKFLTFQKRDPVAMQSWHHIQRPKCQKRYSVYDEVKY